MLHRAFIVLGAGALAALYSCSDGSVGAVQRAVIASADGSGLDGATEPAPDAGAGSDAGTVPDAGTSSGSDAGTQIRFRVAHSAGNMRDAGAASARLDRLLADDIGGLGSLGYGGCALDPATLTRSIYPSIVSIFYAGDSTSGSFSTSLAQGSASAEIVCASGPIPPPDTGPGSDTSSPGPESAPILDPPAP